MRPALFALFCACAVASAAAADAVWPDITLVNRSALTIVQVKTNDGAGWSQDWLAGQRVPSGGSLTLRFQGRSGPCDVEIAIVASDYTERRYPASLCGTKTLTLTDEAAIWE